MEWVKWLSTLFIQRAQKKINYSKSDDDELKLTYITKLHKVVDSCSIPEIRLLLGLGVDIEARDQSGLTPLLLAFKRNFVSVINLLLENGASVNVQDREGCTPLHFAVIARNANLVRELIRRGANIEEKDRYGKSALQISAYNNDWNIFDILLSPEKNCSYTSNHYMLALRTILNREYDLNDEGLVCISVLVNIKNYPNDTPLHIAVTKCKSNIVRILLHVGAEVDSRNNLGRTPLHIAIQNSSTEIVKLLLEAGAGTNARENDNQEAPIFSAIRKRNTKILAELLNHGADKEVRHVEGNRTPLLFATNENLESEAMLLLEYGAEVNVSDSDTLTPLDHVTLEQNFNLFQKLLNKGALMETNTHTCDSFIGRMFESNSERTIDLILKNNLNVNMRPEHYCNKTPLHIVVSNVELVELLLNNGADIEAKDDFGETPLFTAMRHYSALNEGAAVVELLLERGANTNIINYEGKSLLHYAISNSQFVDILLEKGIDIEIKDISGKTPIFNATLPSDADEAESAVDILLKRGAKVNAQDNDGRTLLHEFAVQGNPALVRFLLDNGADLSLEDNEGQTPFFEAVLRNEGELDVNSNSIIRTLIEKGTDVNSTNKIGKTVLFYKINSNLLKILLNSGADINIKDNNGQTALHLAMLEYGRDDENFDRVMEVLIENGANMLSVDNEGITPLQMFLNIKELIPGPMSEVKPLLVAGNRNGNTLLHVVVQEYGFNCIKHFIELITLHNVDINSVNRYGETPLHLAAEISSDDGVKIVKELLSKGAAVNVQDEAKETPLHKAVIYGGTSDTIHNLLLSGARMDIMNKDGNTPLHLYSASEPQDNIMIKHIVKLKTANLHEDITCNKESVDLSAFSSLRESCLEELKALKEYKCDCLSLFHVFCKSKDPMFASSSKIKEIVESPLLEDRFPIYDSYLKVKFKEAEVRNTLLNKSTVVIADAMQFNIPNELLRKILSELSNEDLVNLVSRSKQ